VRKEEQVLLIKGSLALLLKLLKVLLLQVFKLIQRQHVWINGGQKHKPQYNK
jgi:hypothetical protein